MKNLKSLRKQIDRTDESIVILLTKRMEIVKDIGKHKTKNNTPIFDEFRWQKVIKSKKGYLKKIWEIIHKEALEIEKSLSIVSEVEL